MQRCKLALTPSLFLPATMSSRSPTAARQAGIRDPVSDHGIIRVRHLFHPEQREKIPDSVSDHGIIRVRHLFPRSSVKRSRIPACLAAVGLRDDKVAGAKRKEECGCGCAREHQVRLKILENDSWRSENCYWVFNAFALQNR